MHPEVWYDAIILIRKKLRWDEGNIIMRHPEVWYDAIILIRKN